MHSAAIPHRPRFVLDSMVDQGNGAFVYTVSMDGGEEESYLLASHDNLKDATQALDMVETAVDTLLDRLARQGALIAPPKVEPAFQPGESYLGAGHQMTHAEAVEAGRMGMAAVSGLDAATMRVPGVDDPDPAVHAAIREAQEYMAREAAQDQAAEGVTIIPDFRMAPMAPLGREKLDELTS